MCTEPFGSKRPQAFLLNDVCGKAWKDTLWSRCNPTPTPCLIPPPNPLKGLILSPHETKRDSQNQPWA